MKERPQGLKLATCRKSEVETVREAVRASQRWVWWAGPGLREQGCIRTFLEGCRLR